MNTWIGPKEWKDRFDVVKSCVCWTFWNPISFLLGDLCSFLGFKFVWVVTWLFLGFAHVMWWLQSSPSVVFDLSSFAVIGLWPPLGPVDLWVGAMNPAEQREFIATNMDSDLQFILDDSGVVVGNMVAIARRFGTLKRFNALGDDRASH